MELDPYPDYEVVDDDDKEYRSYTWKTAIGLQEVDHLQVSPYLHELAQKNIDEKLSFDDVEKEVRKYYNKRKKDGIDDENRTEEADLVSTRIAELLSTNFFTLDINTLIDIHKFLFRGIYSYAGKIRDYNITKKEWILNGDTVYYEDFHRIWNSLAYELSDEKKYEYDYSDMNKVIKHLSHFVSRIWQVHAFSEGNTRTVAVFFIKFLRAKRFDVTNDLFEKNAFYFRNALVRANYENYKLNVNETTLYLERFLRNLLLGEDNKLDNNDLKL